MKTQPVQIKDKNGKATTVHKNVDKSADNEKSRRAFRLSPLPVQVDMLNNMEVLDIQGTYDIKKAHIPGVAEADNYGQGGMEFGLAEKSSVTFGQSEIAIFSRGWTAARLVRGSEANSANEFTIRGQVAVKKDSLLRPGDNWETKEANIRQGLKETYDTSASFHQDPDDPESVVFELSVRLDNTVRSYDFVGDEEVVFIPITEAMQELAAHKPFNALKNSLLDGSAASFFR